MEKVKWHINSVPACKKCEGYGCGTGRYSLNTYRDESGNHFCSKKCGREYESANLPLQLNLFPIWDNIQYYPKPDYVLAEMLKRAANKYL